MGDYKVWCPAWDSEETASTIQATSSQDAAEQYAEKCFDEPFKSQTFHVIRPDGTRKVIRVDVDWDPNFYGIDVTPDKEDVQP